MEKYYIYFKSGEGIAVEASSILSEIDHDIASITLYDHLQNIIGEFYEIAGWMKADSIVDEDCLLP